MKKFVLGVVAGVLVCAGVSSAQSATGGNFIEVFYNVRGIEIDGKDVKLEERPFIYDGKVYVSARDVANALGKKANWDSSQNKVEIGDAVSGEYNEEGGAGSIQAEKALEYEKTVSGLVSAMEKDWPDDIDGFLNGRISACTDKIQYLYFANENSNMYCVPNVQLPEGYDPRNRVWYEKAVRDSVYISEIYEDAASGKQIITVSKAVYLNGKLVGVLGADFEY